jgi:predicted nucleic acid-binding Zn ribbon protein
MASDYVSSPEDQSAGDTPEHVAVYLRFRREFGGATSGATTRRKRSDNSSGPGTPFSPGRDPRGLGDVIDGLATHMGWESPLSRADLLTAWPEIVGLETSAHATPAGIEDGVLTVHCDSTAWATQLRLMRTQITTTIASRYPAAEIQSVRFEGPNAPSWKRGPRSIPGRGPRDTYG